MKYNLALMKKLTLLFGISTLCLAALCAVQTRRLQAARDEVAARSSEVEATAAQLMESQAAEAKAREHAQQLAREADASVAGTKSAVPEATTAVTSAAASGSEQEQVPAAEAAKSTGNDSGFGGFLSKMMDDPDTRKLILEQQRSVMNQLYTPLVKQLALSPEESEQFKSLLSENMLKSTEKATALFGMSESNRTEMLSSLTESQKSFDEEVKSLLGENRYAQYKDFQLTLGERAQLNMFRQAGSTDFPLSDQQTEQLLAIMKEEKKSAAAASGQDPFGSGQEEAKLKAMMSDEQFQKLLQSQETVNQRVLDRANEVLSPEQMQSFGNFQTNQLQMMRLGMNMARKMFAPPKQ